MNNEILELESTLNEYLVTLDELQSDITEMRFTSNVDSDKLQQLYENWSTIDTLRWAAEYKLKDLKDALYKK